MNKSLYWQMSWSTDPRARILADRHYSRQKIGTARFVPPGRCLVLLSKTEDALWVTSWPFAEYVKHKWAGAWTCSIFRNEGSILSSLLIIEALAITQSYYSPIPDLGMITFVDTNKVKKKRDFGRCFLKAGFHKIGYTKGGLLALQLKPDEMPEPIEVPLLNYGGTIA